MIDPNKSVVIFSHPRSGSTWFQQSLPHFNLSELFLLRMNVLAYTPEQLTIIYSQKKPVYEDESIELKRRFDIYSYYADSRPVSVKIHTLLITEQIIDFLKTQDVQYVLLSRKNKSDTFWSALIAWHTMNWHGVARPMELTVRKQEFDAVTDWMKKHDDECKLIRDTFDVKEIYYEDFIHYPKSEWFDPSNNVIVQNAKSVTKITNIDEVNQWIAKSGMIL